ncbi:MAG: transporter substrate-binding domain-containing protein [Desulfobacterales bacterium]|nr:transporter substrate-binding domain-containing protein [Desulfobacterales bacterium]
MALDGECHALFDASKKASREEVCYYPDEFLLESKYVFFIKKENAGKLKYETFDDLKNYKIGVTHEYSYTADFWAFLNANKNFDTARTDEQSIKKLLLGRVDYFPGELGNINIIMNDLDSKEKLNAREQLTYLPKPLTQKPYYIIFNKKKMSKEFVDKFSEALKNFKQTDEFAKISEKYFGK